MFVPGNIDMSAFKGLEKGSFERKLRRLLETGVLMDVNKLITFLRANIGDMTF